MAKKKSSSGGTAVASAKDKKTMESLRGVANDVADCASKGRAPSLDVPSRSLSNVKFNKTKRFLEMKGGTNTRELFNLSQAKAYMQTLLVGSGCKRLIEQQ